MTVHSLQKRNPESLDSLIISKPKELLGSEMRRLQSENPALYRWIEDETSTWNFDMKATLAGALSLIPDFRKTKVPDTECDLHDLPRAIVMQTAFYWPIRLTCVASIKCVSRMFKTIHAASTTKPRH